MMSLFCSNIHDMPSETKKLFESLLKRPLRENERIFIAACEPEIFEDREARRKALIPALKDAQLRGKSGGLTLEEAEMHIESVVRKAAESE